MAGKNQKRRNIYMDDEDWEKLERLAVFHKTSRSKLLAFLIRREYSLLNPRHHIEQLKLEINSIERQILNMQQELNQRKTELKKLKELAPIIEQSNKTNLNLRQAIENISRALKEKRIEDAKTFAVTWSKLTGLTPEELLIKAKKEVEKNV